MKLESKAVAESKPGSLETQVLEYLFARDQAKKFKEQQDELSEIIKKQIPVGEPLVVAGHKISVSEFSERRFMPMAEAEKIVGSAIVNQIVNSYTKQRLNVR